MLNLASTGREIAQLAPLAQKACNLFLADCKGKGINILITETYRSQARHIYITKAAPHQEGCYLDKKQ